MVNGEFPESSEITVHHSQFTITLLPALQASLSGWHLSLGPDVPSYYLSARERA